MQVREIAHNSNNCVVSQVLTHCSSSSYLQKLMSPNHTQEDPQDGWLQES